MLKRTAGAGSWLNVSADPPPPLNISVSWLNQNHTDMYPINKKSEIETVEDIMAKGFVLNQEEYLEYANEYDEKAKCEHEKEEIRKRQTKDGRFQYVYQCVKCGNMSPPVSKSEAFEQTDGKEPDSVNRKLCENWKKELDEKRQEIYLKYYRKHEEKEREKEKWYSEYLQSAEWRIKRDKVLKRAKGICEGCLERKATVVHHLTYRHIGNEFMFELLAVCKECHNRIHAQAEREEQENNLDEIPF